MKRPEVPERIWVRLPRERGNLTTVFLERFAAGSVYEYVRADLANAGSEIMEAWRESLYGDNEYPDLRPAPPPGWKPKT